MALKVVFLIRFDLLDIEDFAENLLNFYVELPLLFSDFYAFFDNVLSKQS